VIVSPPLDARDPEEMEEGILTFFPFFLFEQRKDGPFGKKEKRPPFCDVVKIEKVSILDTSSSVPL